MKKKPSKVISVLLTVVLLLSVFVAPVAAKQGNTVNVSQAELEVDALISGFLSFADDLIERRTAAMIGTKKTTPESALGNGMVYESTGMFAAEQTALAELNARRDVLREWGEAYTHSFTELTLQRADIKGGTATLDIEEFTKLYYAKIRGEEPDYTAWVAQRRFVFANGLAGWELVSYELLNGNGPAPVNEPTGVTEDMMRRTLAEIASVQSDEKVGLDGLGSVPSVGIQSTFSHSTAADYARKYWQNPNTAYRSFKADCTNFISQAMRAGGWTDVPGWYRDPRHWWYHWLNQTWSWVGVEHWYQFALMHNRRGLA